MTTKPYHEVIAEKLIAQLKQGTAPWQKPWKAGDSSFSMPLNPLTNKRYKGINALSLMAENYSDPRWMTYKQAENLEAQVRKGEKGSLIQYWKFSETKVKKDENGKPLFDSFGESLKVTINLERPRVFYATVFNGEQIEGLPPHTLSQKEPIWNALQRAEDILKNSGAIIRHGEFDRAFYRPSTDSIHMPGKDQFNTAENYYATVLHELSHWSGHSTRLDRDLNHPFGSIGYAKEELRAEIASMILGESLMIGHDPEQHVAYVESWIKILQEEPMEIFRAAADAEKIQDFVLTFEQKQILEQSPIETFSLRENEKNTIESEVQMEQKTNFELSHALKEDKKLEKIWLDIPFKQKEAAKQMAGLLPDGRKAIGWDKASSRWFANPGADLEKLKPWLVEGMDSKIMVQESKVLEKKEIRAITKLTIPYLQREAVKDLAGRLADGSSAIFWDKTQKSWFANPGAPLDKLSPWITTTDILRQESALTPVQEFSETLRSLGCIVSGNHPIMDGKKHRIETEGDKKGEKAGFYVGHLDGHPAGFIKNNRTGIELKWKSKGYVLSEEQKTALQMIAAQKIEARLAEQSMLQEQVASHLKKQMTYLIPVSKPTPYLESKGIKQCSGIFTDKEGMTTYIPGTDENGKVWTMQYIKEEGAKRFAKNSRKEGCFHAIGGMGALKSAPALVIAEGYATADSVAKALGFSVVAAFDAGNLKKVASVLHEKFKDKPVVIIGDDDRHLEITQGINPGKTKAMEAAKIVNGTAIFPIFATNEQLNHPKDFTDFNDLAVKSTLGMEGVKRQVTSIIEKVIQKKLNQSNAKKINKKAKLMQTISE